MPAAGAARAKQKARTGPLEEEAELARFPRTSAWPWARRLRPLERRFELADFVFVEDARLNDGLLVIDLVREVPEAMKPKSIAIKTGAPLAAVENQTGEAKAA